MMKAADKMREGGNDRTKYEQSGCAALLPGLKQNGLRTGDKRD